MLILMTLQHFAVKSSETARTILANDKQNCHCTDSRVIFYAFSSVRNWL